MSTAIVIAALCVMYGLLCISDSLDKLGGGIVEFEKSSDGRDWTVKFKRG